MGAERKCDSVSDGQKPAEDCSQLNSLGLMKNLDSLKIESPPQAYIQMVPLEPRIMEYMKVMPYRDILKKDPQLDSNSKLKEGQMKSGPSANDVVISEHRDDNSWKQLNNVMDSMQAVENMESPSEKLEAQIREQLSGKTINADTAVKSFAELFDAVRNEFGLEPGTLNRLMRGQEQMRGRQMSKDLLEPWMNDKGIPKELDKDARLDLQGVVENANDLLDLFRKSFPGYPPERMDQLLQEHQKRLSGNPENKKR